VGANIPPEDLFAVHDIGALGYFAPREIVDLAGLVTPEIVPLFGQRAAIMEYICQSEARWMMVLPDQRYNSGADADDPRLRLVYESPYDYMDRASGPESKGHLQEPWKMRVYAIDCASP
jgi:hypothetical protein